MKPRRLNCLVVTLLAASAPSFAQPVLAAKSGLLSYAEGDVTINGEPVDLSGVHFSDVKENAVLKTADGRAEVLLTPGVILRLGENSSLRMVTNRLIDTRVELLAGSAVIEADQIAKDTSVTMVDQDAVVTLPKAGLFRFDATPAQLKVFKGEAEVEMGGNTAEVSTGHVTPLSGAVSVTKFDAENTDALDRWSHRRASYLAMANTSAANSLMNSTGGYGGYGYGGYGAFAGTGLMPYGAMAGWGMQGCASAWAWNQFYSMMTYMPCYGSLYSPYGYRYWSPYSIGYFSGYAPGIWGGGASRTGVSSSGSASLARPVATASNRANAPTAGMGANRGAFSSGANNGASRVGASAMNSAGASSGIGGGNSGSGFSGGGHASGGASGGGGHAGGGGGHGR